MARKKKNRNNPLYYTIPMEECGIFHRKLQYMVAENTAKGLITFLSEKFSQESLKEMYGRYRLGICDTRIIIYPYIDVEYQLRCLKRMKYGEDGKRYKNGKKATGIGFLCSSLKEKGVVPAAWKQKQCLFGEHLLSEQPDAPVVIVESEKTAIICSMLYPECIWLATGGCGQIKPIVWIRQILSKRKVLLFPDTGEYDYWKRASKKHSLKCRVAKYMEFGEKEWNTDIADLLMGESGEAYFVEIKAYLDFAFKDRQTGCFRVLYHDS